MIVSILKTWISAFIIGGIVGVASKVFSLGQTDALILFGIIFILEEIENNNP